MVRHILSLSPKPRPRVMFLGTAQADAQDCIDQFYDTFTAVSRHDIAAI